MKNLVDVLGTVNEQEGRIEVEDGSVLKLKMAIVDVKESGFSPFGGINFGIKPTGGIALVELPEELREMVEDKPISPKLPKDGWEIIKIIDKQPAFEEVKVSSSKGDFKVRMELDPIMASRNMKYKSQENEPLYHVSWANKSSWSPAMEE